METHTTEPFEAAVGGEDQSLLESSVTRDGPPDWLWVFEPVCFERTLGSGHLNLQTAWGATLRSGDLDVCQRPFVFFEPLNLQIRLPSSQIIIARHGPFRFRLVNVRRSATPFGWQSRLPYEVQEQSTNIQAIQTI